VVLVKKEKVETEKKRNFHPSKIPVFREGVWGGVKLLLGEGGLEKGESKAGGKIRWDCPKKKKEGEHLTRGKSSRVEGRWRKRVPLGGKEAKGNPKTTSLILGGGYGEPSGEAL